MSTPEVDLPDDEHKVTEFVPKDDAPVISPRTSRLVAGAFAALILVAVFAALAMLIGWGLVELYGLLFG